MNIAEVTSRAMKKLTGIDLTDDTVMVTAHAKYFSDVGKLLQKLPIRNGIRQI